MLLFVAAAVLLCAVCVEIQFALLLKSKELLLDEETRTQYDSKLKARFARQQKLATEDDDIRRMRLQLERREKEAETKLHSRQNKMTADLTRKQSLEFV